MARLRNGFSGGFSGKVGSIIGYRYRDQDCIKGLPKISNKAPSQKQLESRARFKALNDWRNPLSSAFALTFKNHTKSHSAQNAAHRFNLEIVTGTYPNFEVDYSKAVISQGDLPMAKDLKMERQEDGNILFTWDKNTPDNGDSRDLLYLLVICKGKDADFNYQYTHPAERYKGQYILETHSGMERGPIHIYATFLSNDRERAANSVYLGELKAIEAEKIAFNEKPKTPKGNEAVVAPPQQIQPLALESGFFPKAFRSGEKPIRGDEARPPS